MHRSGIDAIKYHTLPETQYGKVTKHHTQESQEVSHFPADDHNAASNGQDSITMADVNINNKKGPQNKYLLGTVIKIVKVKKNANIRNRYNQVPHLAQNVTKHKKTSHTRQPRGQPFPSRRSQGCINRQDSITKTTMKHKKTKQKIQTSTALERSVNTGGL